MPRKPLDEQHNGRFVNRHLSGINNFRRYEAWLVSRTHSRYQTPMEPGMDWAVIRNPDMRPLLHRGKKSRG